MIEVPSTIALGLALFALSRMAAGRPRKILDTAWMTVLALLIAYAIARIVGLF